MDSFHTMLSDMINEMSQDRNDIPPTGLFSLPSELRQLIWRELLVRGQDTAGVPRSPQILSTSKSIYSEAISEMQNHDEVLLEISTSVSETSLTIGSRHCFKNTSRWKTIPAYEILDKLPSGLEKIRRVTVRIKTIGIDLARQRSNNTFPEQAIHILHALASAFSQAHHLEVELDTSSLRSSGYMQDQIDRLVRPLSRLRALVPNPKGKKPLIYASTEPCFDIVEELAILNKEKDELLALLARTGFMSNGALSLNGQIGDCADYLVRNASWTNDIDGLELVRDLRECLDSPWMRDVQRKAMEYEEAKSSEAGGS